MRSDNTTKRTKSQGWPFAAILGFFSAFHYADANFIAVPHRFCRLRVLHK